LRSLASQRLADVDRLAEEYVGDEDGIQEIGRRELAARLKRGDDLVIVDVRPREEYEAGHLPGALSIPVEELSRRIRTLPKGKPIVTYCRGRYCAFSHIAGRLLRKRGFDVLRLEDGLPEWEAGRLPVERDVTP
jgi:rhodanese-related sulfurtransferase